MGIINSPVTSFPVLRPSFARKYPAFNKQDSAAKMAYELVNSYATLPRTTRGMPIVLGGDPKGKNFLYVNGNSVIIRDIANPSHCDVYTEHSCQVNVAKYSPSGFYIASGDNSGKVRIWDTTQKEHILKNEFQPFFGPIKDLAWSGDNQRICVAGEGREKYGHVFNADTGTSVGEIMGQSKPLNSVDFRAQRPFRIVTASEDNSVAFFQGPPFKFNLTINDHSRFANCVRYSPNGETFISGGADGRAFIYDGKTAEKKGELGDPAHQGGIYALCFSPDSTSVLTVSGDKTAKIWNVTDGTVTVQFNMGQKVEDMQVGCLWQGEYLLTISLSGYINYLDKNNPDKPTADYKGTQQANNQHGALTGQEYNILRELGWCVMYPLSDGSRATVLNTTRHWDIQTGNNNIFQGKGHSNQIQDIAVVDDLVVTIGIDDTLISSSASMSQYGQPLKMPSQPKGLDVASGGLCVVACINNIVIVRDGRIVYSDSVKFEPQCVAIHSSQGEVAIGGGADNSVHIYKLGSDILEEKHVLQQIGSITNIKYSPDDVYMAAADGNRKIVLYALPDYTVKVSSQWSMHTAKVNSLAWSPDSLHIASAAHAQSQVVRVEWLDNKTLISAGHDSCIKRWIIDHQSSGVKGVK
ncbi:hypothetical protein LSH36_276g00012 [Paralvinella palmiformis]|uniref:Actin-interacting protein 1 n=1 Tax=Paralvinella palmiformis TaxID=53620 RepID=A0AAD9N1W2_9ANNE|nr:hypothetical protein LSH36_276g00012 [Paralvinella palmiformis]